MSDPVSLNQLLAGEIVLGLTKNGEPADNVRFVQNQDAITVMAGGDTVFGVSITDEGIALGYIYTDSSYSLVSVERHATYQVEIYADQELTERPVPGGEYQALYVKFNAPFDRTQEIDITGEDTQSLRYIPAEESTADGFLSVWVDWLNTVLTDTEPEIGQAITVENENPSPLPDDFTTQFFRIT